MANRGSTTAFQTEIKKDQSHPLHLIEVYLDSATYYVTDNYRDVVYNSNTYDALGFFLNFANIEESTEVTASRITLSLSGVDQQYTNLFLTENYVDRRVVIRKAFIDTSNALIANPVTIFDGRLDSPVITEDADTGLATIAVVASNQFVDFEKTPGRYTNHENQQLHYPGDNGFIYASQIIKDIVWGQEFNGGNRVEGAGSLTGEITGASYTNTGDIGTESVLVTNPWGNPITISVDLGDRVYVNVAEHDLSTGDTVEIDGAEDTTEVPATSINGEKTVTVADLNTFYFDIEETVTVVENFTGGKNLTIYSEPPITTGLKTETTTNKENYVEVLDPTETSKVGDFIKFENTGDIGGITEIDLTNRAYEVKEVASNGVRTAKVAVVKEEKTTAPPISTDTTVANTVTINIADHELNIGDTLVIAGSADVGGVAAASINGTKTVASIKSNNAVNVTVTDSVTSTVNNGGGDGVTIDGLSPNSPFVATTSGSTTVTFHHTAHGLAVGDTVSIIGCTSVGGVPASDLNKSHIVASVPNANSFTVTVATTATSTAQGGGAYTYVKLPVKASSVARGGKKTTTLDLRIARPQENIKYAIPQ